MKNQLNTMKYIPILFSTPMVQAILNGSKTQTRRIIKPQPLKDAHAFFLLDDSDDWKKRGINGKWSYFIEPEHGSYPVNDEHSINPKVNKGDILWVRETWHPKRHSLPTGWDYEYKATAKEDGNPTDEPWKPSIFMPKKACRIFLKVKDVRIEKLQDISEEDIYSEGIKITGRLILGGKNEPIHFMPEGYLKDDFQRDSKTTAFAFWASLWSKINGLESWNDNPHVWVYDFERIDRPESFN